MLISARKLLAAQKVHGFFSVTIVGKRGIGKSSYALKSLHEVFLKLGYDEKAAWKKALDHCLYRIPDIVDFLDKSHNSSPREIGFIWDDAAVFGSGQRWFTHHKEMQLLHSLMDTIRGSVSGMLVTCPDLMELAKFLRRYDDHLVRINYDPKGGMYRIAKGYVKRVTPAQQVRVYTNFHDFYHCYLPNWVYELYREKRERYNQENIAELKKIMKERS